MSFHTVRLRDDGVELLDQRRLPTAEEYVLLRSGEEVAEAIEQMVVRGAPAIGVTAAMGVAIELTRAADAEIATALSNVVKRLQRTRPTAVNLSWALRRMERELQGLIESGAEAAQVRAEARALAQRIHDEDIEICRAIGDSGIEVVPTEARVLTHCNAGGLATAGYGTALGVIRSAWQRGRIRQVLASETRPFLQGARLTAWELAREKIPVVLITDSMGGSLMRQREIDVVIVGADRIARNGDVANKIGTYTHAVLARAHGVPFYVAAPLSTIDLETATGDDIPIEQRSSEEVVIVAGVRVAPLGVEALHPAFDVTPADLISGIITERGIVRAPFEAGLQRLKQS